MKSNSLNHQPFIGPQGSYMRLAIALLLFLSCLILFSTGCKPAPPNNLVEDSLNSSSGVIAVCYPLQFLSQQIAGETMQVTCIVPADADVKSWRPSRDDIRTLQDADMIIANGRGAKFANWLDTVSLSDSKLCLTATKGLNLSDYIAVPDVVHSHGPEGEHSHSTMIAYTWLDPKIAEKQAMYIAEEMSRTFPDQKAMFAANLEILSERLTELSNLITKTSTPQQRVVLTTNSDLKFLTRSAGLLDHHFTWASQLQLENAEEDIQGLLETILTANADQDFVVDASGNRILLSTFPVGELLQRLLRKHGIVSLEINRLDHQPKSGDYISVMTENLKRIVSAVNVQEHDSKN